MTDFKNYFITLESLHFPVVGAPKEGMLSPEERVKANLKILQDFFKLSAEDVIKCITMEEDFKQFECKQREIIKNLDEKHSYCLYSIKMLLDILSNANFSSDIKENLISERHKALIISSLTDVAYIGLQNNLHEAFYKAKGNIFKNEYKEATNFVRLEFIVEIFAKFMHIKPLQIGKSLDEVHLWYMAAIFSIFMACDTEEYHLTTSGMGNLQCKLQKLWLELSSKLYYRNLMLMYSIVPHPYKTRIHREMLLRLWYPGGFVALLFAMSESQRTEEKSLDETIATLVAQPQFSLKAQQSLLKQILQFLKASLRNKELSPLMGAGILSARKLYDNKQENKEYVKNWFEKEMQHLIEVENDNLVAMEWLDFVDLISLLFHIFCTSSIATLPSNLLITYLPVFLELYAQLEGFTNQDTLKHHLQCLVLKILNNCSKEQLKTLIECVACKSYTKEYQQLPICIQIRENVLNTQELKLSIVDIETMTSSLKTYNHLPGLINILKNSSFNLLTYQHFIILLQQLPALIMDNNTSTTSKANIDLLQSEEDICTKFLMDFSQIYEHKLQIITSLESLIQHQPIKVLINDNIMELLKALQDILTTYAKLITKECSKTELNLDVLMILLVLIREILENCSVTREDLEKSLLKPLKQLETHFSSGNLKYQLQCVLNEISRDKTYIFSENCTKIDFEAARNLMQANESYLQVEGIEKMIKLLQKRDEFAMANCHILAALALNTLKSPESYTFLNCVRLFVVLVQVNEVGVLDLLSDEFLNESANMDYRLVIGEAIIKTSMELGSLCYKYKNILLNTFMTGCRSPLNEFRLSAFSNLAQLCRLLTYQVHNYFQELLNLIDCELTTGEYLPSQRAAVMVLSDLLAGMDNIFDYEEMLLPIYRLLKHLVNSEKSDEKIRIHASNGLKCLSEKCQELFKVALEHQQNKLEKEIKIMGLRDKSNRNLKGLVLEMN